MGPDRTGTGLTESAACVVLAQDDVHHKQGIPPMGTQPARLAPSVVNTRRAAGLVGMCMVLTLASICNDGYLA
jgi:hypothetical protein